MTKKYVEASTAEEAEALAIELGKALAQKQGKPYPIPPDVVGPGRFPCGLSVATPYDQLSPEQQAMVWHQERGAEVVSADGVHLVDVTAAEELQLQGEVVDGKPVDLSEAKVEAQLSVSAKAALAKLAAPVDLEAEPVAEVEVKP